MTVAPAGVPRAPRPDPFEGPLAADAPQASLRRLLWGASALLVAGVVLALALPPAERRSYLVSLCVGLVFCGALPLIASFIQYLVIGLHRFHTGYERLRPYYPRVAVILPAWNEGEVIGSSIERLLAMDYPEDRVRVYVVDDASTDATPDVVQGWQARAAGRVWHLRREKGGQGKAHTLNHGIAHILGEPWAEAVLIMDADVLFEDSALRRMARHLSRPDVGAVMAYIKEGSVGGNYLNRLIGYEYITAQAAARRAQNVFGALSCLAGGAQLHSRENLIEIGSAIDTSTLAEDTFTTFRTQLTGRKVVFEGNAVVWAEEPGDLVGLWKQRLRWARGNVQISLRFSHMWFRGGQYGALGRGLFALIWFAVLLMPLFMIAASCGLIGIVLLDAGAARDVFRVFWRFHAVLYVFVTAMSFAVDPATARRSWGQGLLFPGVVSLGIIVYSIAPVTFGALIATLFERAGIVVTAEVSQAVQLFCYVWLACSMVVAYAAKWFAARLRSDLVPKVLVELAGYGALLCAVTLAAYVREIQGAGNTWDKTIKTGKAAVPR